MCLGHQGQEMKCSTSIFHGVRLARRLALIGAALSAAALTGCYVVPLNQVPPMVSAPAVYAAPPPASMTFTARLYPANQAASAYGMVGATVTNDLHGRGTFSTIINGETFIGEATRKPGASSREGLANGVGNRGGYINCRYQMNTAVLGTGQCELANGAQFTMHVGN